MNSEGVLYREQGPQADFLRLSTISSVATMSRYFILLAGLLATISASANADSYFRVVLSGGGEVYEYRFAPHTFSLSLASRCSGGVPSTCAFFADPVYQADSAKHSNVEKGLLSRFRKEPIIARASADSRLQRAVLADYASGKEPYKFEVYNLKTDAIEMSATTKRRISAAEMLGTRGCVLLLTSSYRIGWMPWDLLFTLAGHPPQYDTYYLEVYGADGKMLNEFLIKKDLKYSSGYVLPHLEDELNTPLGPNDPC